MLVSPVRVRWVDAAGHQLAWMLCPGMHTAEERAQKAAPDGAVLASIEREGLRTVIALTRGPQAGG